MTMRWIVIGNEMIASEFVSKLDELGKLSEWVKNPCDEIGLKNDADIAYVSIYGRRRFDVICELLQKGYNVISEKPMFNSEKELLEAKKIAEREACVFGEANTILYMPLLKELKSKMQDIIGNLKFMHVEFGSLKEENIGLPVFRKDKSGGSLYDVGIYALTIVQMFVDSPCLDEKSVLIKHLSGVDERCSVQLKYKDCLAGVDISIRNKLDKRCIISGDKAYVDILNYPRCDKAKIVYPSGEYIEVESGKTEDALLYEIQGFEQKVRNKDLSDLEITKEVLKIMDKVRKENKLDD